ncbi:hypothetical protein JCM11491_003558 [Sporobolomyces phaffii]
MESAVLRLGDSILDRLLKLAPDRRVLVGIAGAPGSGKSTLAYPLVEHLNRRVGEPVAVAVGLDGWHHSRDELDRFPDPVEARRRRGAAFTFDAASYVAFIRALRTTPAPATVSFPVFSHAVKDPTDSPAPIVPGHRVVIVEGLYTLLDVAPWTDATDELDLRVWVECDRAVARERLIRRHLESGIEPDRPAAEQRVDGSDMKNGEFIREHLVEPDLTIASVDDPDFATSAVHEQ